MSAVKLGDVCKIVNGGTPKTGVDKYWGGNIFWITPKDLGKVSTKTTNHTGRTITQSGVDNSSAKVVPANSVILSTRAPIGHVVINAKPMAFNQGCRGLVPNENFDTEFLYYFLKLSKEKLNELGTGTTFRELSSSALANVEIPLPSVEEQRRVVARLDAAFEKIDRAIELCKRNIQNADALISSTMRKYFHDDKDTERVKFTDVCEEIFAGGDVPKSQHAKTKTKEFQVPIFTNGERNDGLYGYTNIKRVEKPSVTVAARGTIGYSVVRTEPFYPAVRLIVMTPDTNKINLDYFGFAIKSLDFSNTGSAIPQLTVPMIKTYEIGLPDIPKQNEITQNLTRLTQMINDLLKMYDHKLKRLHNLKQSMLSQAFLGDGVE